MRVKVGLSLLTLIFCFACQKDQTIPCSDGEIGRVCREDFFIGNSLFRSRKYEYFNDHYYVKIIMDGKGARIAKEENTLEGGQLVKQVLIDQSGNMTSTKNIDYQDGRIAAIMIEKPSNTSSEKWIYANNLLVGKEYYKDNLLLKKEENEYVKDDTLKLRTLFLTSNEVLDSTYEYSWFGTNLYRVDKFLGEGGSLGYELTFFNPDRSIKERRVYDKTGALKEQHLFEYESLLLLRRTVLSSEGVQLSRTEYVFP